MLIQQYIGVKIMLVSLYRIVVLLKLCKYCTTDEWSISRASQ